MIGLDWASWFIFNRAAFLFLMRYMDIDDALYTHYYPEDDNQITRRRSYFEHNRPCTTAEWARDTNDLEDSAAILIILY
jgi:hypothetical protein